MSDPTNIDLVSLLRKGIEDTLPLTGKMCNKSRSRACVLGCIKLSTDLARWYRIHEQISKTTIAKDRLPDVEIGEGTVLGTVLQDTDEPSLHLVLTTLNDKTSMSRTAIAEWLDHELTDKERTVLFGKARDIGYVDKSETRSTSPVPQPQ